MLNFSSQRRFVKNPIPVRAGIGLRFEHINEIIENQPKLEWLEIHAENYMGDGGPSIRALEAVRQSYPISVHGVGLSIGGAGPLDEEHLNRHKKLVERIEPGLVSEHLAWCNFEDEFLNDLLPLPYTRQTLETVVEHVNQTQDTIGRQILIENPSLYLAYNETELSEPVFLKEVARRTGCGLLLDVNNVFVSASNLGFDPYDYLLDFDMSNVHEIHLAGHHERPIGDQVLRIDDHGSPVSGDVWELYETVLEKTGAVPTLIEWDANIPTLATLEDEAARAQNILSQSGVRYASAS